MSTSGGASCAPLRANGHDVEVEARPETITLGLIDAFRALRERKFQIDEARDVLARSHPEAFRDIRAAQRSAAVRAAGPQPAPGTERRGAWTRQVADGETRP